jgi:hypothetical protein
MPQYAARTEVSSDRTQEEIRKTLTRYGAKKFCSGFDDEALIAFVMFEIGNRRVRFVLRLPSPKDRAFWTTDTGRQRTAGPAREAYEQAVRQRWRALSLVIKAKLEACEAGITTIEDEFLAHTLLPDGRTVGESVRSTVDEAYRTGQVPALLPGMTLPALAGR